MYRYHIQYSDGDLYSHTNHVSYVRFCHDAASMLVVKGVFSVLKGDLAFRRVRSCVCSYLGESVPGDVVDIHVWEDPKDARILYFDVVKDGKSVCQCMIDFH